MRPTRTIAPKANARVMDNASARHRFVGALADRMRNRSPEAAYAAAISQIEALHTSPALSARQARVGTLLVLDALAEALTPQE
jgi:hypothetical protein